MEKDGFFGNPAGFNWQSESHNTPLQVAASMGMNTNHSNIDNSSGSGNGNGKGNGNGIDPSQSSSSSSSILAATCCLLNLNWDQSSTDQTANFESALSSLVSSPSSSNPNPNLPSSDSIVIRELIGRLGSICNNNSSSSGGGGGGAGGGDDISPPNSHYQSTNTSCYSTPLNSPPKLNISIMDHHHPHFQLPHAGNHPHPHPHHPIPFAADPGFAERAARFSCFGPAARSLNYAQFGPSTLQEPGKLSRVSSSQSLKTMITNTSNGPQPQPQPRMGPMNVNGKETPMHLRLQLQQQQEEDGIGIGIGTGGVGSGQLETEDMMMLMMMRSSSSAGEFGNNINNINAREESSASDRMAPSGSEGNVNVSVSVSVRKRKATTPSSNKGGIRTGKEAAAPVNTPQVGLIFISLNIFFFQTCVYVCAWGCVISLQRFVVQFQL